jgi:uncharacterized protein YgbK (DUF1537 family)
LDLIFSHLIRPVTLDITLIYKVFKDVDSHLAGNTGDSETVTFMVSVPKSFPIVPIVAASGASIVLVGAAGLLYYRKRRQPAS